MRRCYGGSAVATREMLSVQMQTRHQMRKGHKKQHVGGKMLGLMTIQMQVFEEGRKRRVAQFRGIWLEELLGQW